MVSEKPGESSSSRNGNVSTITNLTTIRNHRFAVQVTLDDGFSFLCPTAMAENLCLAVGASLTDKDIKSLALSGEILCAKQKALDYLASAEHAERQLKRKLCKKGFSVEAVGQALQELAASGALDDGRYAGEWIRARLMRRPEGPAALVSGLKGRGVARALAEDAVARAVTEEVELETAQGLVEKYRRKREMSEEDVINLLKSRGFSWRCISRVRKLI